MRLSIVIAAIVLASASMVARADAVFNFESTPVGTALPLTLTNSGITATISGNGSVCAAPSGMFSSLSGNVVIQEYCSNSGFGTVKFAFDQNLSSLSFDFATSTMGAPVTVGLFENGTAIASATYVGAVPPGFGFSEGLASVGGTFNSVTVSTSNSALALDNLDAVAATPEPSSLVLLGTTVLGAAGMLRRRIIHG